jgi:hypothetical protein
VSTYVAATEAASGREVASKLVSNVALHVHVPLQFTLFMIVEVWQVNTVCNRGAPFRLSHHETANRFHPVSVRSSVMCPQAPPTRGVCCKSSLHSI